MQKAVDHRRERSRPPTVADRPSAAADLQSSADVDEDATTVTVATWNLQGSAGLDVAGVADVISGAAPDVFVVQEVGWWQSRRLAGRLGMRRRWAFKHYGWPGPEGLAVLTPHRIASSGRLVLRSERWWDWRRRIAIRAEIDRRGTPFGIINVHLSPHDDGDNRRREAAIVLEAARRMPRLPVIAGDCNDFPSGPGPADFGVAGWVDAWTLDQLAVVDGSTNWTSGERRGRAPTQRLDYVFAPPGWTVVDAQVLASAERFDWFAERSDHLPVLAELRAPQQ
jgi:endonuclease/exonuclease/phosphatase family metal-dependent hydrolase